MKKRKKPKFIIYNSNIRILMSEMFNYQTTDYKVLTSL